MRKVKDILKELNDLEKSKDTLDKIIQEMRTNNETQDFMRKTFGVNVEAMHNICLCLCTQRCHLENRLNECEVDI